MDTDTSKKIGGKEYDYVFKIVLIGDTCVGKSCLLVRFADDQFSEHYVTTIGVDFRFKTMIVKDKTTKIQIWDTAGQERYRSITNAYYRGAEAIVIVFDLTNKETFNHINDWIEEITKFTGPNIYKIVVGNKVDLADERKVSDEDILVKIRIKKEFEKKNGIRIVLTSAKSGNHVENAFRLTVENLIERKEKHPESRGIDKKKKIDKFKPEGNNECCK